MSRFELSRDRSCWARAGWVTAAFLSFAVGMMTAGWDWYPAHADTLPRDVVVTWVMDTPNFGTPGSYDFPQTRADLASHGCRFKTQTDVYTLRTQDDVNYLAGLTRLGSPADDARLSPHDYHADIVDTCATPTPTPSPTPSPSPSTSTSTSSSSSPSPSVSTSASVPPASSPAPTAPATSSGSGPSSVSVSKLARARVGATPQPAAVTVLPPTVVPSSSAAPALAFTGTDHVVPSVCAAVALIAFGGLLWMLGAGRKGDHR